MNQLSDYSVNVTNDYIVSVYYDFEKKQILFCSNGGDLVAYAGLKYVTPEKPITMYLVKKYKLNKQTQLYEFEKYIERVSLDRVLDAVGKFVDTCPIVTIDPEKDQYLYEAGMGLQFDIHFAFETENGNCFE